MKNVEKRKKQKVCRWLGLPRSVFYHKRSNNKRGRKVSTHTMKSGIPVMNQEVVDEIKNILSGEFVCYGYQKTTHELRYRNFIINPKKVYRLMDENNLLLGKNIKTNGKREWVKHRKINANRPMEYLCLDIKYVWVHGDMRNYYLLTIIDVYSRKVLGWIFQRSIRHIDVIELFVKINATYGIKGVYIRNDNGSQFIANKVRAYLRMAEANQEFTHIATPEENSYIEAYHSIFEREVIQRFEFAGYYDALQRIKAYVEFYNNKRLHGKIKMKTPQRKWNEYFESLSTVEPQSAQVNQHSQGCQQAKETSIGADTGLALDNDDLRATFAQQMMNEKVLIENQFVSN